jgi:alkylation response protein AidB-like acyl-CoA dehydrogenase
MIATESQASIKGGEFLIKETPASQVFIPEEFTEEQQMIAATCQEFLEREIWPRVDEIDKAKSTDLISSLMDKAGELGLLGTGVPEEYGGFGMSFNTSMLVAEVTGAGHSFSVALSAHTGIGTLPIVESRLLPDRTRLRLRCQRGQDQSRADPGRQKLRAERPENVDHQRRIC